jgi:hypothetical protein
VFSTTENQYLHDAAKQLAGTNTSLAIGPRPQMLLSEDEESADDRNPVPPARKKPAAPLPLKVKCRSGHLDTYEESEVEDESHPLPLKTKHPRLVTTPPPQKTKRTRLVESDDDVEDVEAPPVKKKTVPPPKTKHPRLIESADDTEDVEAPPVKKTMVPPQKTKRTRLIDEDVEDVEAPPVKNTMVPPPKPKRTRLVESDEDVDDVKAPPVKKKPVPTPSLPMLKRV